LQRTRTHVADVKNYVEPFDTNVLGLAGLIGGLGAAMVWLATRLKVLEQRPERRCPACGIIRRRGACSCTS
jgi:hypothetical protein